MSDQRYLVIAESTTEDGATSVALVRITASTAQDAERKVAARGMRALAFPETSVMDWDRG